MGERRTEEEGGKKGGWRSEKRRMREGKIKDKKGGEQNGSRVEKRREEWGMEGKRVERSIRRWRREKARDG